ncbi:MAG: hypothetical protein SPI59_03270 [Finegoldia sp.]|nr:hypothetical protein [Finegoldia sp.]
MGIIKTPLGEIIVKVDNKEIDYKYKKYDNDSTCPDLLGRYLIEVQSEPTGQKYKISCEIMSNNLLKGEIESGEMLSCMGFYGEDSIKLSIGTYGEEQDMIHPILFIQQTTTI